MRVLDVSNLHDSLDETIQSINEKIRGLESVGKSIDGLVNLNHSFNGKGAEAIKSYYQSCHQPFLFKLRQVLVSYKMKILSCKEQVSSYEPDNSGFIHEEFLQSELTNKLTGVQNYTNDVTVDANQFISNVLDIVYIELLDDTEFNHNVETARQLVKKTVTDLEDFDLANTSSLDELTGDLNILATYIEEMATKVEIGGNSRDLVSFSPLQMLMSPTYGLLVGSIRTTHMDFFKKGPLSANRSQSIYTLQSYSTTPYQWLGLNFTSNNLEHSKKTVEPKFSYLTGGSVKEGDFTFEAGAGKSVNNWSGFDGDGQLGGSSKLSGIHTGVKHDTDVIDSSFDLEIGAAEATASIGGKSIFPLVKAGGTAYAAEIKTQLDKDIDYVGRTGLQAKGEILKANAYAGVDNSSIGFGAKASVAEGEISGILPIPFTDINIKGTVGASAFGVGGEAKIGKETMIDLRLLLGIKLGISFEKE